MTGYLVQRLVLVVPTLVALSVVAFVLTTAARGDPALLALQQDGQTPTPELVAEYRARLGLDAPLPVRYLRWIGGVARGDLGRSMFQGRPVAVLIGERVWPTIVLGLAALVVSTSAGITLGMLTTVDPFVRQDGLIRGTVLFGAAIPSFWLAIGLITLFGEQLRLLPVAGYGDWQHLVLPVAALALGPTATVLRLTRAAVRDIEHEDYIRTARAKGLTERSIRWRHLLPNAAGPLIALTGVRLGHLLAGAVIVESIFAWPGLGTVWLTAISGRDVPVIGGLVLVTGALVIGANLLTDVIGAIVDPKIRFERSPW